MFVVVQFTLYVMEALFHRYQFDTVYSTGLERVGLSFYQVGQGVCGACLSVCFCVWDVFECMFLCGGSGTCWVCVGRVWVCVFVCGTCLSVCFCVVVVGRVGCVCGTCLGVCLGGVGGLLLDPIGPAFVFCVVGGSGWFAVLLHACGSGEWGGGWRGEGEVLVSAAPAGLDPGPGCPSVPPHPSLPASVGPLAAPAHAGPARPPVTGKRVPRHVLVRCGVA